MLAKAVARLPDPEAFPGGLGFEPKWDGFRCIVFRDGDNVQLASRSTKELTRYFPELVYAFRETLPPRCVIDGEIILVTGNRLDFERLQERVHPAASRVRTLSQTIPASFVAFDLLAEGDDALVAEPFGMRRSRLEQVLADALAPVHLTPTTREMSVATKWFEQFEGAGLDGVVAKQLGAAYQPGVRAMMKIKHRRTADVVLAGYRLHSSSTPDQPRVGSLLLGLYDHEERLQHVGVSAAFTAQRRTELIAELKPLEVSAAEHPWAGWQSEREAGSRLPGSNSRWSAGKDLSFVPLDPIRVIEVAYDHMEGTRFRHTAQFKRWRPDREARSCGYDQLEVPVRYDLGTILGI